MIFVMLGFMDLKNGRGIIMMGWRRKRSGGVPFEMEEVMHYFLSGSKSERID